MELGTSNWCEEASVSISPSRQEIPRGKWLSLPSTIQAPIASRLAVHQDHPRSIALDPNIVSILVQGCIEYSAEKIPSTLCTSHRDWCRNIA